MTEIMTETHQQVANLDDLKNFYLKKTEGGANLFEIWEKGDARGDSVTPSTYSTHYRNWMTDRLAAVLEKTGGGLLSLGCGNAAVEAEVVHRGFRVLAVDAMQEAVVLARGKGVEAVCADITQWAPDEPWSVLYMDGLLGHLCDSQLGLRPILERVRSWLAPADGADHATLIASNDAPKDGSDAQQAPGVDGFRWLSPSYMRDQAIAAGFTSVVAEKFLYERPISGERVRAIVSGHIGR
jgi:hypothetical protein